MFNGFYTTAVSIIILATLPETVLGRKLYFPQKIDSECVKTHSQYIVLKICKSCPFKVSDFMTFVKNIAVVLLLQSGYKIFPSSQQILICTFEVSCLLPPTEPWQPLICFPSLYFFPFLEFHMNRSRGCVIVCLPLLNKMLSRFRHDVNISSFSLFIAELHFILWIFQNCPFLSR